MKPKIGLVSYHRDPNYGTMLQAFALAHTIKKAGVDCEYLDYYEYSKPSFIKRILNSVYCLARKILHLKNKAEYGYFNDKEFKLLIKAFDSFHNNYIPYSRKKYYFDTVTDAINDYEFFIVGSDQTWSEVVNKSGTTINFLEFVNEERKKRSYAPSIGTVHLSDNYISQLKSKLKGFQFLSCRERQNCVLLQKEITKNVQYVVDPTLLLSASEWNKFLLNKKVEGSYVLAYILGTKECICNFAETLGQRHNLPVYYILTRPEFLKKNNVLDFVGPLDFVSLIKNASYIVTDSFHGTIFSINFKKEFYCFTKRSGSEATLDNDRIRAILNEFGLSERLQSDEFGNEQSSIDYESVHLSLNLLRESSLTYLNRIIK